LGSLDWSGPSSVLRTALRAAAESAVIGALGGAAAAAFFRGPGVPTGIAVGVGTAWLVSSASAAWMLRAQARSPKAFWRAFGGGMAGRAAALAALMAWSWRREDVSVTALLLSYAFGVLALLLTMETRYFKAR
jgi:hypothetical protein